MALVMVPPWHWLLRKLILAKNFGFSPMVFQQRRTLGITNA